jgi:hypothetical protein
MSAQVSVDGFNAALSRASRERMNRPQKALFQTQRLRRLGMASRRSLQFILCLKPREFQKSSTLCRATAWGRFEPEGDG